MNPITGIKLNRKLRLAEEQVAAPTGDVRVCKCLQETRVVAKRKHVVRLVEPALSLKALDAVIRLAARQANTIL